jgi:IclR family acetate operon transcriptional repressor
MPPTGKPAERRLEAVERAMRVLDAFLDLPGEVGTNEISRRTGINASTVSRLLSTLVSGGYVQHLPESGRYRLGPHLIRLANHVMSGLDLRSLARPHLVALEQATEETATLSVAGERDAVTVDFIASRQTVASVARIGRPSVAHATATGKVMLAFGDESPLDGALERFTDRTVTDRKVLRREIDRVREQGWAQAVKERESDLNAVAAPVFGAGGTLAAILGVQGPAGRFGRKKREAALPFLQQHADAISGELGYTEQARPVK